MKVFIVDDEPPAIRNIEILLKKNEVDFNIEQIDSEQNSLKALERINETRPEVVFLDVEMPELNGFELLSKIDYDNVLVVFVTAYSEYALKAFEVNAINYLVKPISPSAFTLCLQRIDKRLQTKSFNKENSQKSLRSIEHEQLALRDHDHYTVVYFDDIIFIGSNGSYSEFHLLSGRTITHTKNLKHCVGLVSENTFLRISRSALINTKHILSFSLKDGGSVTMKNGVELLIGRSYRSDATQAIKQHFSVS